MNLRVLACAEQELVEVVDYYNEQVAALGFEFAAEVKNTFERIVAYPNAWPVFSQRARRCFLNKFPYGVLYQIRQDYVLVLAIMHVKQDPKHWKAMVLRSE